MKTDVLHSSVRVYTEPSESGSAENFLSTLQSFVSSIELLQFKPHGRKCWHTHLAGRVQVSPGEFVLVSSCCRSSPQTHDSFSAAVSPPTLDTHSLSSSLSLPHLARPCLTWSQVWRKKGGGRRSSEWLTVCCFSLQIQIQISFIGAPVVQFSSAETESAMIETYYNKLRVLVDINNKTEKN